jgi:transposase
LSVVPRAIGRTKGGLNSKLHAVCDSEGRPVLQLLTEGQQSGHKEAATYCKNIYKQRHRAENLFSKLKDWRRITMRFDPRTHTFLSAIQIAATVIFWFNQ